jgi:hypothetical protein
MRVVDGAKGKWAYLMLMDGMIHYLDNFANLDYAKRIFHQRRVLSEIVLSEIAAAEIDLQNQMQQHGLTDKTIFVEAVVQSLHYPWDSAHHFNEYHQSSTPTKARQKFLKIVDILLTHPVMNNFHQDMLQFINAVVAKIMASRGLFESNESSPRQSLNLKSSPKAPSSTDLLPSINDTQLVGEISMEEGQMVTHLNHLPHSSFSDSTSMIMDDLTSLHRFQNFHDIPIPRHPAPLPSLNIPYSFLQQSSSSTFPINSIQAHNSLLSMETSMQPLHHTHPHFNKPTVLYPPLDCTSNQEIDLQSNSEDCWDAFMEDFGASNSGKMGSWGTSSNSTDMSSIQRSSSTSNQLPNYRLSHHLGVVPSLDENV